MLKAIVAFKKAIADIDFKKAIAELKFGDFLSFRFFFDALGLSDSQSKSILPEKAPGGLRFPGSHTSVQTGQF